MLRNLDTQNNEWIYNMSFMILKSCQITLMNVWKPKGTLLNIMFLLVISNTQMCRSTIWKASTVSLYVSCMVSLKEDEFSISVELQPTSCCNTSNKLSKNVKKQRKIMPTFILGNQQLEDGWQEHLLLLFLLRRRRKRRERSVSTFTHIPM